MSTLKAKITLNTEAFKKGVAKVKDMARRMGKNLVERFKKAGKALAVGIGAGMAAAGIATVIAAKKILTAGDQIQKMSLKTGFSAKTLSQLKHAAEQSGASIEGLDKTVKSMNKSVLDADRGSKTMLDNFNELGINVNHLKKLKPEQQFEVITQKIAAIEDPSRRAAIATALLGRSGRDLIPMLALGSEGLQKMKDDADKLGITMSGKQVNNIAAFNDAVDRMQKSILGIFQAALGFEDMKILVDKMTASLIAFRESAFFQKAVKNITNLASNVLAAGNGIINVVSKTGTSFFKLAGMVGAAGIAAVVALKSGFLLPIVGMLAGLYTFLAGMSLGKAIYDSFDFSNLWENIKTQFNAGLENIGALIAYKLGDIDEEEFNKQVGENSERVANSWKKNQVKVGSVIENFKKNFKQSNDDVMNTIGGFFGIPDVQGEIDKIKNAYKEGVGEFENASLGDQGAGGGKGAIGEQADEAERLNKQLKQAGKQVNFVLNLDKFKNDRTPKGGIISGSLRKVGQTARDRFDAANSSFRESYNAINDKARRHFVTAGTSTEKAAEKRAPISVKGLAAAAGGAAGGGAANMAEGVRNHTNALNSLVNLATARNAKLDTMITLLTQKGKVIV